MKKFGIIILFVMLFQFCGSFIASTSDYKGVTYPLSLENTNPMNFRSEPDISSSIIGLVDMFTVVNISGESGEFFSAEALCSDGVLRTGYLSKLYIKKAEKKYSFTPTTALTVYKFPNGSKNGTVEATAQKPLDIYFEINEYLFFIDENNCGFVSKLAAAKKVSSLNTIQSMTEILNSSIVFALDSPFAVNRGTRSRIDAPAFLRDGWSMIPIRYAAEWFGGDIHWDDASKCVYLNIDDRVIKIFTGKTEMYIDEKPITLGIPPVIVNDRSFIPIRAFAEALGKHAYFVADKRQIIISDYILDESAAAAFCEHINTDYNLYSDLKIEDMKISPIIPMGKSYSLSGKITSDRTISRVAVFIYDSENNQELKESADNNSATFSMKSIDNAIKFNTLTSGDKRIEIWAADEAQSRLLYEVKFTVVDIKDKFFWPVPISTGLSGCYGQDGIRWHPAIDITGENGTDVVASADGIVIDIYNDATDNFPKGQIAGSGYGNYVKLEHTNKINGKITVTKYNHLARATVKVGDKLLLGDKLGELGSTGSSYGFHLDYQVFLNGEVTDPGPFIMIPNDLKFTGTTVACCIPYIDNLKAMNNMN